MRRSWRRAFASRGDQEERAVRGFFLFLRVTISESQTPRPFVFKMPLKVLPYTILTLAGTGTRVATLGSPL